MKEYSIEITLDELGRLEAETFNFKGEMCETEVRKLLSAEFVIEELHKKDEYFESEKSVGLSNSQQIRNGRKT